MNQIILLPSKKGLKCLNPSSRYELCFILEDHYFYIFKIPTKYDALKNSFHLIITLNKGQLQRRRMSTQEDEKTDASPLIINKTP